MALAILATITAFLTATAFTVGTIAVTWGAVLGTVLTFGGIGLSLIASKQNRDFGSMSPSYSNGMKQTQTNQDLPIPLLYGTCKLAGNRIWQADDCTTTIRRIIAFAEGEICEYSDIRLNDIPINEIGGISVARYYGTPTQIVDPIIGGYTQAERAAQVGSLRDVAYLAIIVPVSQKINGNYNLTAVVKGRKIRVYENPFSYEVKYSENPAWVMFDFLTSYNGLGLTLTKYGTVSDALIKELFDLESFIEAAAFCDELVNEKPRFTFNMIFDAQTSARTLIDEIYRSCRGGLFLKDGKLQFKIDKPEPVSKIFTSQDIINGSENFQTLPKEEHYDILKCEYISPQHEWQKVEAFAEIPEYRDGVPIEHSVNIYSCTNFEQASRLAWYYVNSKSLQPYFGSFKTDYRAYDLEVGDVIIFDSLLMGLERYRVKVTSVTNDGGGTYTVNWRTYDERLYKDTLGSLEPRVLISNLDDISKYPDDVKNFSVVQTNNLFSFIWQSNPNINDTYEIRFGDKWESGAVIGTRMTGNSFSYEIPGNGLYKFWIKAFNNYNYSKNPTLDVVSIDAVPNVNEIVKLNLLGEIDGTCDENIKVYHHTLKLKENMPLWQITGENWQNYAGCYQTNGYWGSTTVEKSGTYTGNIFDIGSVLENILSYEIKYFTGDAANDVLFEWRYSNDSETWTDWDTVIKGTYTFRYCQFRVTLRSYNNIQTILTNLAVSVDVPDKEIVLDTEITDSEGLRVEYSFINVPAIVATVNDNNDAYVVVSEKTNTYAILKAYTNAGELTTCKLSLRAKGY